MKRDGAQGKTEKDLTRKTRIPEYTVSIQMGFIWSLHGLFLHKTKKKYHLHKTQVSFPLPEGWHLLKWSYITANAGIQSIAGDAFW